MAKSGRPAGGAFVVTGPTSGIGLRAAIELADYGPVILVGRHRARLEAVRERIAGEGGRPVAVLGDVSDIRSIRGAAAESNALDLPIRSVLNNAGVMFPAPRRKAGTSPSRPTISARSLSRKPSRRSSRMAAGWSSWCRRSRIRCASRRASWACAAGAICRPRPAQWANGHPAAAARRASMPMPPPSNAASPQPWRWPARCRGCTSAPSSRASIRAPDLAEEMH